MNKTSSSWMDGDGFNDNRTTDSYPYSATLPGVKNALQIAMYTYNDEIDYKCTGFLQGFKVTVKNLPQQSGSNIIFLGSFPCSGTLSRFSGGPHFSAFRTIRFSFRSTKYGYNIRCRTKVRSTRALVLLPT